MIDAPALVRFFDSSPDGIAWRVKLLRLSLGMTQAELAARIETPTATVSKWEQASARPTVQHLKLLATACDVTTDFLIYGELQHLAHDSRVRILAAAAKAEK